MDTEAERRLRDGTSARRRARARRAAVQHGVRCAIDVSDGLVQDLGHIATASGVAHPRRRPAPAVQRRAVRGLSRTRRGFALRGGEDYELILVGTNGRRLDLLAATQQRPLMLIGEVVAEETPRVAVVDESAARSRSARGGWDHFGR